jgi:hypothetical protein
MRGLHWKWIAVLSLGALATAAISFAVGRSSHDFKPLPTILATLVETRKASTEELTSKSASGFPPGSSEDDLIDYLDAEGFVPEWPRRNGQNAGRFVHDGILCTKIVRVFWRSDDRGKLTNISGGYASRCVTDPPTR